MKGLAARHIRFVHIPKDGDQGPRGPFIPTPRLWSDYPVMYPFQSGADGEERLDVVLEEAGNKVFAYSCRKAHQKRLTPPSQDTAYWQPTDAGTYQLLATKVLLADNAFIRLLSSNGIAIYDAAGRRVGQMSSAVGAPAVGNIPLPFFIGGVLSEGGVFSQAPLFAVDSNGKSYHGGISGQHIEIDPASKSIRIFDTDGKLCATHSGRRLDYSKIAQSMAASGGGTVAQASVLPLTTFHESETLRRSILEKTVAGNGVLTISVPAFTITATAGQAGATNQQNPWASGQIFINIYADGVLMQSAFVDRSVAAANASVTTDPFSFAVNLRDGQKYKVEVQVDAILVNPVSSAKGSVTAVADGALSTAYVGASYNCEYGANGFYISTNSSNYIYAIFDDTGRLRIKAVANGTTVFSNS